MSRAIDIAVLTSFTCILCMGGGILHAAHADSSWLIDEAGRIMAMEAPERGIESLAIFKRR